ncbi:MAG TPA: hypothetical protein VMT00_02610 [Thermoanaerobaculia bacterium]|nr:hypothetical protein [Thermoanaerobaculia bacterium]
MKVKVKEITIWRGEFDDRPGKLAEILAPLADAGADLSVVMGYKYPAKAGKAAFEVYPINGRKEKKAAKSAGLTEATLPALLVEGADRAGLGYDIARAIADRGIDMTFLVTQVIGRKYSAIFGFETKDGMRVAAAAIKRASSKKR